MTTIALAAPVVVLAIVLVLRRLASRETASDAALDRMTRLAVEASLRPRGGHVEAAPIDPPITTGEDER